MVPAANQVVMDRDEIKEDYFPYSPKAHQELLRKAEMRLGKLTYVGHLQRSRRSFWPQNKDTDRIFHISIDKCQRPDGKILWQMEVEYVARKNGHANTDDKDALKQIIQQETAELADIVFSFCNKNGKVLTPTNITKFNWLINEA